MEAKASGLSDPAPLSILGARCKCKGCETHSNHNSSAACLRYSHRPIFSNSGVSFDLSLVIMSSHTEELFVDRSPSSTFLATEGDQPVWPLFNNRQYQMLVRLAARCGASVTEVRGQARTLAAADETVLYHPRDLSEVAHIYAHLTRRKATPLEHVSQLRDATVLLTTYESLSLDWIERLYADPLSISVPGIICLTDRSTALEQCLYNAASAHLTGPHSNKDILVNPLCDMDVLECGSSIVAGVKAPKDKILDLLSADVGLKMVITHSDGVDAFFGEHLTMCGILDRRWESWIPNPRCIETGWCHRQNVAVEETLNAGGLVSPSIIQSWILFWGVCWGLSVNSRMNTQWNITRYFAASRIAPAIITTWGVEIFSAQLYLTLAAHALGGMPVGELTRRLTLSSPGRQNQLRLCLMGDPRVRLPARNQAPVTLNVDKYVPIHAPTSQLRLTGDPAKLEFLKVLAVDEATADGKHGQAARALLNALATSLNITQSRTPHASVNVIQSLVMQYVTQTGLYLLRRWMKFAPYQPLDDAEAAVCSWCLPEVRKTRRFIGTIFDLKRRFSVCSLCGTVEDTPYRSKLNVFVEQKRTLRLQGIPQSQQWAGQIVIIPQVRSEHFSIPWQRKPDGMPVTEMRIEQNMPIGQLDVGVVFMFELDLYVLSRTHRGPTIG